MLIFTHISLASVNELYKYKLEGFSLPEFPGYTTDQWGIKAHNRPWLEEQGHFSEGHKIIEVGGGYSLLPLYLAQKYNLEAWNGDDFGQSNGEPTWSRWGDPRKYSLSNPQVKYVFENFGNFSPQYPNAYFDRIFTISTLEHIPTEKHLDFLLDTHRCLAHGGLELHTIDIALPSIYAVFKNILIDKFLKVFPFMSNFPKIAKHASEIFKWVEVFQRSGVRLGLPIPNPLLLLNTQTLIESYDVVYRFYPPNNSPKPYRPSASLLLIIENQ